MSLFKKAKGGPKEKALLNDMLKHVVTQTQQLGFTLVPETMYKKAEKLEPGLIALKAGATADAVGNIAVYATSKAVAAITGDVPVQTGNVAAAPSAASGAVDASETKPVFQIRKGVPIPEASKRGGGFGARESIYPFGSMEVGDSFTIPADKLKSMGSTISSVNKRYAAVYPALGKDKLAHPKAGQPTGKDGRKFAVRREGDGAGVWRIA